MKEEGLTALARVGTSLHVGVVVAVGVRGGPFTAGTGGEGAVCYAVDAAFTVVVLVGRDAGGRLVFYGGFEKGELEGARTGRRRERQRWR